MLEMMKGNWESIGSAALGLLSAPVSAATGLVSGFKSWMDHKQVEFQRDAYKRYIDNMRIESGNGNKDVLKMEMISRLTDGGDALAYFKAKENGGISWSDNKSGDLYWHPDEKFKPTNARYIYIKDLSVKHYGAKRKPASQH